MVRALGLAGALWLLAVPPASAATEPSGQLVAVAEESALRLHDLPPGYQISDESGCGSFFPGEGVPEPMAKWIVEYWPEGCSIEYQLIFRVPGLGPAPPEVAVETVNTPSEEAVGEGLKLFAPTSPPTPGWGWKFQGTVSIGPAGPTARLFRYRDNPHDLGFIPAASTLLWRHGNLIAVVEASGMKPRGNDGAALRYAEVQQGRLEAPSPYTEAERYDKEVALDDPSLKFPIYWVGNPFQLSGRPPVELESAYTGWVGPPGEKYLIDYELLEVDGLQIGGWTRHSWKRFQRSALWKVNRPARCTQTTEVELDLGRAVIYGSYDRKPPRSCPRGAPDRYYAIAHIDGMVIGINLGNCLTCLPGAGVGPHASVRGMTAIVRSLVLRPKPVY